MTEFLERINRHLEFLMDCTIEPSSVRASTQKLIDEIESVIRNPKSNADRIRHMTDDELASVLCGQCTCCAYQITDCTDKVLVGCEDGVLEWLKQEAKEEECSYRAASRWNMRANDTEQK